MFQLEKYSAITHFNESLFSFHTAVNKDKVAYFFVNETEAEYR